MFIFLLLERHQVSWDRESVTFPNQNKDIHFFRIIAPNKSLKIMGLEGIHLPEALQWWSSLTFCLWCRKEDQNEGMVVNHLQTMHYHVGLVCTCCLNYFTMSADAMWQHTQLCKTVVAGDDDDREEYPPDYEEDKNCDGDFKFVFKED